MAAAACIRNWASAWRRDRRGATAVEFALVAPVLVTLLLGTFEYALLLFASSALENAVAEAARFGITGRSATGGQREQAVRQTIKAALPDLFDPDKLAFETLVYPDFDSIGRPEPFVDRNANGRYDRGEPFTDVNGNGRWDEDMGKAGLGGPNAVVLYRARYSWTIQVPFFRPFFPPDGEITLEAAVAVRNEPFPES